METQKQISREHDGKVAGAFEPACTLELPRLSGSHHSLNSSAATQLTQVMAQIQPVNTMMIPPKLTEKHLNIAYGACGYTYESMFGAYLIGAKKIIVDDPYIREPYQINNFLRFCELVVKSGSAQVINLTTGYVSESRRADVEEKLNIIGSSLLQYDIKLSIFFSQKIHDREIRLDNGWAIQLGRGFDIYQKVYNWLSIGALDLELRPCHETSMIIYRR